MTSFFDQVYRYPSDHTITSDMGSLLRKSAAASDRPGSEPSKKVVIVKFEGFKIRVDRHKISFSLGAWFFCKFASFKFTKFIYLLLLLKHNNTINIY